MILLRRAQVPNSLNYIYIAYRLRYLASNNDVTLKYGLYGSFKVTIVAPFDSSYMTFYWSAIVNIALLCHFLRSIIS